MGTVRARKLARAALRNMQTEPVFRLFLKSHWNAHPGGAALPYQRAPGIPDDFGGNDAPVLGFGHHQHATVAVLQSMKGHESGEK